MEIFIKGELKGLNDYTLANRRNKYAGASIKKRETEYIASIFTFKPKVEKYPIKIIFTWHIHNRAKDLDNVSFAKKYILDGMVKAKIIQSDNLTKIIAFEDQSVIVKEKTQQGVHIRIIEDYKGEL